MDYSKRFDLIKHPAHLWIGQSANEMAIKVLKEHLYISENNINAQIEQYQHPSLLWIKPEKMYTLSDIEPIFEKIKFRLEPNNFFFCILEKADFLSIAVANRLLKIIEEPPTGYHMLFLASRFDQVIPTIRSRCLVRFFDQKKDNPLPSIARFFLHFPLPEPTIFLQTIDKLETNEQETFESIDQLLIHWQSASEDNQYKIVMLEILTECLEKPPMPGSTKLFWKNFYLQTLAGLS